MSCPICGNAGVEAYRPFCSKRCADVDLARWMNGAYAVPSAREEDPEEIAQALEEWFREGGPDAEEKPH